MNDPTEILTESMTTEEVLDLANRIREAIINDTCCADHALAVAITCAGSFALTEKEDPEEAAKQLVEVANAVAQDIRSGAFRHARMLDS